MITGASSADAAVLVIAANEGVREQSRRHAYLLSLLGIKQVTVVVNKMDLADFSEKRFQEIEKEYRKVSCRSWLGSARVHSGLGQDRRQRREEERANEMASRSDGAGSSRGRTASTPLVDLPLRFCVQDVYRFDDRRIIAGTDRERNVEGGGRTGFFAGQQILQRPND